MRHVTLREDQLMNETDQVIIGVEASTPTEINLEIPGVTRGRSPFTTNHESFGPHHHQHYLEKGKSATFRVNDGCIITSDLKIILFFFLNLHAFESTVNYVSCHVFI